MSKPKPPVEDKSKTEQAAKRFEQTSTKAAEKLQRDWEKRNPNA